MLQKVDEDVDAEDKKMGYLSLSMSLIHSMSHSDEKDGYLSHSMSHSRIHNVSHSDEACPYIIKLRVDSGSHHQRLLLDFVPRKHQQFVRHA